MNLKKEYKKHKEEIVQEINQDDEVYKENILEHYKNPHNKGELKKGIKHKEINPMCGDELTVYIDIDKNKIKNIKFEGDGCAISVASISMLSDKIKNMTTNDVKKLKNEDIYKMLGIPISIARIKCAMLSLKAIHGAIKDYENRN